MEQQEPQVEIEGVVKPDTINRVRKEWGVQGCWFGLESGVFVYCHRFIPDIRENWIVRVLGHWDKDRDFIAVNVNVIGKVKKPKELPEEQLKLKEFLK